VNGTELRASYEQAEAWQRDALVMRAAFQLDLLHSQLEHAASMLRMAQECAEAWRNLYRDSWRTSMRSWINDKELYDDVQDKEQRREERRELEQRHRPFTEEEPCET